jgi:cyclic beta-1,2-glucan synthetase
MKRQPPSDRAAGQPGADGGAATLAAPGPGPRAPAIPPRSRYRLELGALERQLLRIYRRIDDNVEAGKAGIRAEEWLIDNRHIVQDALSQVRRHLPRGFLRRLPCVVRAEAGTVLRIADLASSLVRAGPTPVDIDWIERTVAAFQADTTLTIGELWALPSVLRLLVLRELVSVASDCLALRANTEPASAPERQTEAVAGAIIGLRRLDAHDWRQSFERLSKVEQTLRRDPAGAYASMDFASRNRYRGAVEELARGCGHGEVEVAAIAIARCQDAPAELPRERHVGYHLISGGRAQLERTLEFRLGRRRRLLRALLQRPTAVYFVLLSLFALPPLLALGLWLAQQAVPWVLLVAPCVLVAIPVLGLAVPLLNGLVTWRLPPRQLVKLDYSEGIAAEHRSAVVVPVLLAGPDDVDHVLERLETNYLNNDDRRLVYVILSDFADAEQARLDADEPLLQRAAQGVRALNARYGRASRGAPFVLLHRERRWNPVERQWMGWERKRGKLMEFNRMLAGDRDTGYRTWVGDPQALDGVAFVITLDADTQMPPGTARRLVGTLAHPLNRAQFEPGASTPSAGYAILQPRLEVDPDSAGASHFARIVSGDVYIDPYTHAVSDVYHDLFGAGIYAGKGIYDWRAFERALAARIADNCLLSHDLLEGAYARVGLATDTILLEQFPAQVPEFMLRLHRWVRGDWQLLPWLGSRVRLADGSRQANPLSAIQRWQILDNLRRSLQPPATLLLLLAAWSGLLPGAVWAWTLLLAATQAPALWCELLSVLGRVLTAPSGAWARLRNAPVALGRALRHGAVALLLLPYESRALVDAIGRTLFRLTISRRGLLEWTPAAQVQQRLHDGADADAGLRWRETWISPATTLAAAIAIRAFAPAALAPAAPLLLAWLLVPWAVVWLARPPYPEQRALGTREQRMLRRIARRTWLFFEQFVGPDDHWLAPDNYQEEPRAAVAHRTSPTNLGMALLSTLAAHDLGYLDTGALVGRLRSSLDSMAKLERYRGHWLNWYDTRDRRALLPRYVSTVDSGNLAASLLVLARGLEQVAAEPVRWTGLSQGVIDTLDVLQETVQQASEGGGAHVASALIKALRILRAELTASLDRPDGWRTLEDMAAAPLAALTDHVLALAEAVTLSTEDLGRLRVWLNELQRQALNARRHLDDLQPWRRALLDPPVASRDAADGSPLPTLYAALQSALAAAPPLHEVPRSYRAALAALDGIDLALRNSALSAEHSNAAHAWNASLHAQLERAAGVADTLLRELGEIGQQAERWLSAMEFGFLYDRGRHLFRIGFNATSGQRDPNYYDLLASESRLTSLVAIAKGDVPFRHWLHLGRPFRRNRDGIALMSWSATLFEYLMPSLFMTTPVDSLLGRACRTAIAMHYEFGEQLGLPWGIAESGYYHLDDQAHYQYRAFGVPGLGFRSDLGDRVVVAPYASAMALPFDATKVVRNLERLCKLDGVGQFGLHEAIDFGRTEKAVPRRARIVRSYMSHHQGMILLALDNYLHADAMLRRFHADRRVAGVAMLLYERLPPAAAAQQAWGRPHQARGFRAAVGPRTWSVPVRSPVPCYTLLSNGHYALALNADGGGGSVWNGIALTRWQPDRSGNEWGHWFAIEDRDDGTRISAGIDPVGGDPQHCSVQFGPHVAEYRRRERGLFCKMTVAVASQHDVEARKLTLRNESARPRRLLVTGFAELALAPVREFERHPAFARLFVESECLPDESLLLFRRHLRGSAEKPLYLAHTVLATPGRAYRFGWDTDRNVLLGRWGTRARLRAAAQGVDGFSGSVGAVLDAAIGTGIELTLAPYAQIELGYLTAVGRSRRDLLATVRSYRSMPQLNWIIEQARMQTEQELRNLEIEPGACQEMMTLLSAALVPRRELRGAREDLTRSHGIQATLWSRGISGDWPIVLVRIRDAKDMGMIEPLLQTHTFWCGRGARIDLVLIDDEAAGYAQPGRDRLRQRIDAIRARTLRKLEGVVVVVAGEELSPQERAALRAAAAVTLDTARGAFAAQLARGMRAGPELPPLLPANAGALVSPPTPMLERPGDLRFDHGLGGFSADGEEYVLHLAPGQAPPAPWSNVIANLEFGCLVTESGSTCTWAGNSSEWRLSPWSNDPVCDRSGEAVYLRDEETGAVWSPTPQPMPADAAYQVRHGAGYSEFRHHSHGLLQSWRVHVDREAPVKLGRLRLTNVWPHARRITATCYVEWVLGNTRADNAPFIVGDYDPDTCALLARNAFHRQGGDATAFLACSHGPHGLTGDRTEFLGRDGHVGAPAALRRIGLSGHVRAGDDPCAAYQVHLDLAPGASQEVIFVLGQGDNRDHAIALARRFRDVAVAETSWQEIRRHWQDFFGALQVRTPEPAMDLLLNRWLPYQVLACRLWARCGYYQSSGAFGFRDQLQDVMALTWAAPQQVRAQILRAASRQFQDGDVLHWWHEAPLRGVRTRCSDDLLWLPFVVAQYLTCTGDVALLGEMVPYLTGPPLRDDESEHYAEFLPSDERGTLYEHCRRAIDRACTVGPHGLPTIGNGDWNDGFNRVSTGGRGESVWLGWFLIRVCADFAPICEGQGDTALAAQYRALARNLRECVEAHGWDGGWYRRAYYDDGTPLGSAGSDECRIDLIAQAWSVLASERPGERARRAMAAVREQLVKESDRLILLLTPPFQHTGKDPGYIKEYPPGIRENGGQYSHAATWAVWASAALGDAEQAMRWFDLLNPIARVTTPAAMARYRVEPYVLAGDVYGAPPHVGRGGWTWYSGAAGWLYRTGVEALLGLKQRGNELELAPCLPRDWPGYHAQLRCGAARYEIEVTNHKTSGAGVVALVLDGRPLPGNRLPFIDDGQAHRVEVQLQPPP